MDYERFRDSNQLAQAYSDSLLIEMRHMDGIMPSTRMELFGNVFDTPIATAAFSHLSKFGYHPDGMVELSRGAQMAGALNFVGMGTEDELERIVATGAKVIKIIKPYADNETILRKIDHAQRVGVIAVGMDLDHSFNGKGEYDVISGTPMCAKSTDEIRSFVSATHLPFFIKGIHSVMDAQKAMDAGVKGLIVSHHHGIINYAVPPLMVLPEVVTAVNGSIPVFADSGICDGYDAFKALALGAAGVCAGRAMLSSLKENGGDGVCKWLMEQTAQLKGIMARTGSASITSIDPTIIRKKAW